MYQLAKIKQQDLTKIQVKRQAKIVEMTGRKLNPPKAYEIIKSETKGFTIDSDKAKQADKLFVELLKKNGIPIEGSTSDSNTRMKLREQERTRHLKLLELELQLAA